MPRKNSDRNTPTTPNTFRFVNISSSKSELEKISKALGKPKPISSEDLYAITDAGWKLSISQHQQHGYYTASLTDKTGRKGCKNTCFTVNHNDLDTALRAATFCATELLNEGYQDAEGPGIDVDW